MRSGQALAKVWQQTVDGWIGQIATGLRPQPPGAHGSPSAGTVPLEPYARFARACLQYDLVTIVASEELKRLLPLHEPLPQPLRDAVLEAADVEIIDCGPLDEEQIELANLAIADIYCQLQQPAAQALVVGRLGALFAALHTQWRSG